MNGAYFYPIVEEGDVRDGLGHEGAHFIASWFAPLPADSYLHIPRIEEGQKVMPYCVRPALNTLHKASEKWIELSATYLIVGSATAAIAALIL
jgi:hypothetical protein